LLRIWRRGKARIEDRWMDEHMYLTEGRAITLKGGYADHNLNDLTSFTAKHNGYASREALDVLNRRLHLFDPQVELTRESTAKQAKIKRFFKECPAPSTSSCLGLMNALGPIAPVSIASRSTKWQSR
jgi:hypothetical protein